MTQSGLNLVQLYCIWMRKELTNKNDSLWGGRVFLVQTTRSLLSLAKESGQNAPRRLELNEINQYACTRIVWSNWDRFLRNQCLTVFLRAFAVFWPLRQEVCMGQFVIWRAVSTLSFQNLVDHSSTCSFLPEWKSAYRLSNFMWFTSKSKCLCC